jgi:heptosyltransferase-1
MPGHKRFGMAGLAGAALRRPASDPFTYSFLAPMRRFLVIRLSSIGDIVHTLPAVCALSKANRDAEITWLVEQRFAGLLQGNPYVQRVLTLDTLGMRRRLGSPSAWGELWHHAQPVRQAGAEAALDFQGLWKTGFIAFWSGARERAGFALPWLREKGARLFYNRAVNVPRGCHVIEANLALAACYGAERGAYEFPLPCSREDNDFAAAQTAGWPRGFIVVNPGGGWAGKRWAPEKYALLLRQLEAQLPLGLALTGSPAEEGMIAEILKTAGTRKARYVPSTLGQYIALVRCAALMIGGDTGPLHLAAAAGTPVVAIYGPTHPARNGPFSPLDIALYSGGPVSHSRRARRPRCIESISVEQVMDAVRQRLGRTRE